MVQIFTLPSCVQCTATKRFLDNKGIEYETVDLAEDPSALEFVKSLGYVSAPVVVGDDTHFSGFQPERLKMLA